MLPTNFSRITELLPDAALLLSDNGTILAANHASSMVIGIPNEQLVGKSFSDLLGRRAVNFGRLLRDSIKGRPAAVAPFVFSQGIGKAEWRCEITVLLTESKSAGCFFVRLVPRAGAATAPTAIDGTQPTEESLRKSEMTRWHSQKMEAIGQLAGGIAHDFNNLITVIHGYSENMLNELRPHDPLYENVKVIRQAAGRAATLTRQLLVFSRKEVVIPVVLDLNGLISEAEKMLQRLIGEDIEIATVLAPDLGNIQADPGQIEQVIINLAVNSRDAMPQGGKLKIQTKNTQLGEPYTQAPPAVQPGLYVQLAVTDTGCGMDAETKSRTFEPFFTTKPPGTGTGMGLATVYGIVKQAGGHIEVNSDPGQGTTFTTYWPMVDASVETSITEQSAQTVWRGTETILVVEDEDMVRTIACRILRSQGYTVLDARTGGEALLMSEQYKGSIHLLITDVVMPQISGRQLADRLRHLRPQMKVLFMSGYMDDALVRHGVRRAEMAFLHKPFARNTLGKKVRETLDEKAVDAH